MVLPQSFSSSLSLRNRANQYWKADLAVNHLTVAKLLLLTCATGIQDAVVVLDYRCLHSAQTGNTIIVSLATVLNLEDYRPVLKNAGTSLGTFILGCLVTGQCTRQFRGRQRVWQYALGMAQTLFILAAVWIQLTHEILESGPCAWAVLGLMASALGSQIAAARVWDIPEITTAMATAAWVDMARDADVWAPRNTSRDLRAAFFAALALGTMLGGALKQIVGSPYTLLVSASIKALAHGTELLAPADKS